MHSPQLRSRELCPTSVRTDCVNYLKSFCMRDLPLVHIYLLNCLLVSVWTMIFILYFWLYDAFHPQKKRNIVKNEINENILNFALN